MVACGRVGFVLPKVRSSLCPSHWFRFAKRVVHTPLVALVSFCQPHTPFFQDQALASAGIQCVLKSRWHEPSRCRPRAGGDPLPPRFRPSLAPPHRVAAAYGSPPARGRRRRVIASHLLPRGRTEMLDGICLAHLKSEP